MNENVYVRLTINPAVYMRPSIDCKLHVSFNYMSGCDAHTDFQRLQGRCSRIRRLSSPREALYWQNNSKLLVYVIFYKSAYALFCDACDGTRTAASPRRNGRRREGALVYMYVTASDSAFGPHTYLVSRNPSPFSIYVYRHS